MHVQITKPNRQIVLWEQDPAHAEADPRWVAGEIILVGYPDEENTFTVGDTPGVRQAIASGQLAEVKAAPAPKAKKGAADDGAAT